MNGDRRTVPRRSTSAPAACGTTSTCARPSSMATRAPRPSTVARRPRVPRSSADDGSVGEPQRGRLASPGAGRITPLGLDRAALDGRPAGGPVRGRIGGARRPEARGRPAAAAPRRQNAMRRRIDCAAQPPAGRADRCPRARMLGRHLARALARQLRQLAGARVQLFRRPARHAAPPRLIPCPRRAPFGLMRPFGVRSASTSFETRVDARRSDSLDRRQRQVHRLGDLLQGHPLDVPQHQHETFARPRRSSSA